MKSVRRCLRLALMLIVILVSREASAFAPQSHSTRISQSPSTTTTILEARRARKISENEIPNRKISSARRRELGIADDEDEYDLEMALDNSTDPFITKVIAGSLILTITALLVAGIILPATTDYGEGVCNPLLTGGRC